MCGNMSTTAYAVQMADGPFVGIWRDRETAEKIRDKQPPSHGDRVVEMVPASELATVTAERDAALKELDAMKAVWNAVIRIPDMSDDELEQFRQNAIAAMKKEPTDAR